MPHMAVRRGPISAARRCGCSASASPANSASRSTCRAIAGAELWETLLDAGKAFGICPYGTETMHVLRAEKGYIIVGQDTDGTVTPDDAGLGWAIGKNKPDFVGKRSLERAALTAPDRKQLVGLLTVDDPRQVLEEGAQIVLEAAPARSAKPLGHVTLLLLQRHARDARLLWRWSAAAARASGQTLYVPMPAGPIAVQVTSPVFYDPTGARINA